MTTMPGQHPSFHSRRQQFIGISVNKLTLKSINIIQSSNNYNIVSSFTLNKSSNWSSLRVGHPLYLIFAKSMKVITLKFCIYDAKALIICLSYQRMAYYS